MKARENMSKSAVIAITALLITSCLLPGMIPLKSGSASPMPAMEKNIDTVIQVLTGKDWYRLEALAKEQYSTEDFAKPGVLTFTAENPNDKPVYFSYGWCAKAKRF